MGRPGAAPSSRVILRHFRNFAYSRARAGRPSLATGVGWKPRSSAARAEYDASVAAVIIPPTAEYFGDRGW